MKKIFLMTALVIVVTSCKDSVSKKTDLEELNLKGSVQSVFTLSYKAIDKFGEGNVVKGKLNSFDNEYILFDSIGNTVSKTTYYIKDVVNNWGSEYDKNGYKIRELWYDDNGKLKNYSSTFINDSIGNPLVEIDDDGDKEYYTYDANGKMIKKKRSYSYDTYEYDKNGNLIEEKMSVGGYGSPLVFKYHYDSNNRIIRRDNSGGSYWENKYDEEGKISESFMYEQGGKLIKKNKYWKNDKGVEIKTMSWDKDGLLETENKYFYLYEDTLVITQITVDKENLLSSLICNLYNSNNSILNKSAFKITSELFTTHNYRYNGNFLTDITYQSDYTNWTENFIYDKNTKLIESKRIKDDNRTVTKYDKDRRVVQISEFDKDNAIVRDVKMKYKGNSDKGTVKIIDKNIKDNTETKIKNTFERGLLVESIVKENNTENIYKYEYNDHNDMVKMVNSKENETLTFKYKYDSKGNWTTKTIFNNEKPTEIQERLIVYH
jgi:YD repeat-containing protein